MQTFNCHTGRLFDVQKNKNEVLIKVQPAACKTSKNAAEL